MEAIQLAQMFLLPSIMLSGYIFPLSSLPAPLRVLSQILPATHFIAISRGIIIRGASSATSGAASPRSSPSPPSLWRQHPRVPQDDHVGREYGAIGAMRGGAP